MIMDLQILFFPMALTSLKMM